MVSSKGNSGAQIELFYYSCIVAAYRCLSLFPPLVLYFSHGHPNTLTSSASFLQMLKFVLNFFCCFFCLFCYFRLLCVVSVFTVLLFLHPNQQHCRLRRVRQRALYICMLCIYCSSHYLALSLYVPITFALLANNLNATNRCHALKTAHARALYLYLALSVSLALSAFSCLQ